MKKLMIILAGVAANVAFATGETNVAAQAEPAVSGACVSATVKERREAQRYGYAVENWCALTKKARKEIRQEALAKKKGMTVAEMKAENNRKAAERAGCSVEEWTKMSVKERCAFRKAKAQAKQEG